MGIYRIVKQARKDGAVMQGITELEKIKEAGAQTLGEYFNKLQDSDERVRGVYTSRAMYEHEFDLIWKKQQAHHDKVLTDTNRKLDTRCYLPPTSTQIPEASCGTLYVRT